MRRVVHTRRLAYVFLAHAHPAALSAVLAAFLLTAYLVVLSLTSPTGVTVLAGATYRAVKGVQDAKRGPWAVAPWIGPPVTLQRPSSSSSETSGSSSSAATPSRASS
jgi:hypothetical protein